VKARPSQSKAGAARSCAGFVHGHYAEGHRRIHRQAWVEPLASALLQKALQVPISRAFLYRAANCIPERGVVRAVANCGGRGGTSGCSPFPRPAPILPNQRLACGTRPWMAPCVQAPLTSRSGMLDPWHVHRSRVSFVPQTELSSASGARSPRAHWAEHADCSAAAASSPAPGC
jgi:hypothetical protein